MIDDYTETVERVLAFLHPETKEIWSVFFVDDEKKLAKLFLAGRMEFVIFTVPGGWVLAKMVTE